MAINSKKISSNNLTKGMYISKLDRPWIETSFPIEGFYIHHEDELKKLSLLCRFVYIDLDLTKLRIDISHLEEPTQNNPKITIQPLPTEVNNVNKNPTVSRQSKIQIKPETILYLERTPFSKEFKVANKLYQTITETTHQVFEQISAGESFDPQQVNKTASLMVESIIRNPDTFLWLSRLKDKDSYTHNRSIRATILAIAFGRHLSLEKNKLIELSIAVLLSNIGKVCLSKELLEHSEQLPEEQLINYQQHIEIAINLLNKMSSLPTSIITTISQHCERYNGSGYPKQLMTDQISFLAQIAGLVCYYEKLTNQRNKEDSLNATRAMEHLYKLRDQQFQAELIEEFIQSIGIYPAGSLIELNSKEVAVIVEQNKKYKLLPNVLILRDNNKQPVNTLKILNLSTIFSKNGANPKIINSLPLGSYGIDADEIINSIQKVDKNWIMKKLFSS
jgi:HD-GYP domain-containing protein (c-di-GMP phosphodiesterase class II)